MTNRIPVNATLRQRVLERDNYTCRYCGDSSGPFHVDHVYPFSKGGVTEEENLVTACRRCNGKKSNKIGWLPNPPNVEEQIRQAVNDRFPFLGILISGMGLMTPFIGAVWSKAFGVDFYAFLYAGIVVGFIGIIVGLKGH